MNPNTPWGASKIVGLALFISILGVGAIMLFFPIQKAKIQEKIHETIQNIENNSHEPGGPSSPENPSQVIVPSGNPVASDIDANLSITTASSPSILKSTFGIQTQGFFDDVMYPKDKAGKPTTDSSVLQNVYALKMNGFRFPGGTSMRYYHPGLGYGIKPSEIAQDIALYGRHWFSGGNCTDTNCNYIKNYQNLLPVSFASAMSSVAKSSGPGRSVNVVANIVYGTPAETVAEIREFQNAGVTVSGVEMGNEHYSERAANGVSSPHAGIYMTTTDYLAKSKTFSTAIRDAYPSMEIGLVAAHALQSGGPTYPHYFAWDTAMAHALHTETYKGKALYDAYIPHIYESPKCNPIDTTYFTSPKDPALTACAAYKTAKIAGHTIPTKNTWGPEGAKSLEQAFTYYRNVYGASTKIWVTEWGLSKDEGGGEDDLEGFSAYANTLLFGAYMQDFYNFMNKYNATYGNTIELAYYHNLSGFLTWTAISAKGSVSTETFVDPSGSKYPRRVPWFALKTMSPLYNAPSATLAVSSTTLSKPTDYLHLTIYYDASTKSVYVYFNNTSGLSAKVAGLKVDGQTLAGGIATTAEIVSAPTLFTGNGANYFYPKGTESKLTYDIITSPKALDSVLIPGYSFGYLKFSK